ncbi:hypothetical protein PSAB6_340132 [Paraburkholderia sabiae]|nr:hypothetical protein PSAB6_340132 [Paraburkholderia sabiae]
MDVRADAYGQFVSAVFERRAYLCPGRCESVVSRSADPSAGHVETPTMKSGATVNAIKCLTPPFAGSPAGPVPRVVRRSKRWTTEALVDFAVSDPSITLATHLRGLCGARSAREIGQKEPFKDAMYV